MGLIVKCINCGHRDSHLESDVNKAISLYNGTLKRIEEVKSSEQSLLIWKSEVETLRLELVFFKQECERLKALLTMNKKAIQDAIDMKVIAIKRREQKEAEKWKDRFGKLQLKILEKIDVEEIKE